MNIGILSRGPQLYSTQSLLSAGARRGHAMQVINHMNCDLLIEKDDPHILCEGYRLDDFDAVIPRIGSSVTMAGAAVIRHFEMMEVFTTVRAAALLQSRNKLQSLQMLARHGIDVPRTVFARMDCELAPLIDYVGGLPVVLKLLESTHGIGVILAESLNQAEATVETLQRLRGNVLMQEYIAEAKGADIRAIVIDGVIVAAMERKARKGEFRSNLHRGATASKVELSEEEARVVMESTRIMGLDIAGVDLLRSARGPLIMEINASPGLEGIEATTEVDVAGLIIEFIEKQVQLSGQARREARFFP